MYAFVPASGLAASVRPGAFTTRTCVSPKRTVARRTTPAKMVVQPAMDNLPSLPLAANMAVTFPAYLAVFLGTLIPVAFLVILYIQAESRKAGEKSARGDE